MCLEFIKLLVAPADIRGKRVLESGARDFNGSIQPFIKQHSPAVFIGTDVEPGSGVDQVCGAEHLVEMFGPETFDVVISTEAVEHIEDWQTAFSNFKRLLTPQGLLFITTRSPGFGYHGNEMYGDYWRYTLSDMRVIFADMELLALQSDPSEPGVFVKARRPANFKERNLSTYALRAVRP